MAWIFFLPLALLAGIGGYYLTEDRRLAHQQARSDAQEYLRAAVQQIGLSNALTPNLSLAEDGHWEIESSVEPEAIIYRDWKGKDLYPLRENPPVPELDLLELDENQLRLWQTAEAAEFQESREAGARAYQRFLKAGPPQHFVFEANYRKAILVHGLGDRSQSKEILKALIKGSPPHYPVHQRAQWHVVTQNLPHGQELESACISWINTPTEESEVMLGKVDGESVWLDWSRLRSRLDKVLKAERNRFLREERARNVSPKIPNRLGSNRDWKLQAYLVDDGPDDLFVMRRSASTKKGHLLVAWTQGQMGQRIAPLLSAGQLDPVHRPKFVNQVLVRLEGRGIWGHTWPTRWQAKQLGADSFADLKMTPLVTNMVSGFEVVAWAGPGSIAWESNKRIAWFALLILFAVAISVVAWKFARRSLVHLDALNQEKSNFVSSVSHELRAPVASMQLMAESLHEGKVEDADKQKEYFGMILQECRRLGALVHNVLDYARIEQRRKEYERTTCDLRDLIEHVVKVMQATAVEGEIRLNVEGTRTEAEVDAGAIQQVLINLLDNAIKFSPPNSEVVVTLSETENGGVQFAVTDCGPGVPEDQREKIFERFYRREDELRRETKGVGIGLSIVKHVVEAHGGRVAVRANENRGAVFTVELPPSKTEKEHVENPGS